MQVKLGHLPHISSNFGVSSGRLYNSFSNFSDLDSGDPLVLFVRHVLSVPLHELDLLFGALQDQVHPHLMSMTLRFHVNLHVVHKLEDASLHCGARGLNVVLLEHLVAFGHEFLHSLVDLFLVDEVLLVSPVRVGRGSGVNAASSDKGLSFDQVVDVLIEVSPGWVSDESNLTVLVDEGANWDCLHCEVGDGWALLVLHVVVVKFIKFLLVHELLLLLFVLIDAECYSSDLSLPLA